MRKLRKLHSRDMAIIRIIIFCVLLSFCDPAIPKAQENRPAAVADQFYPGNPDTLKFSVKTFFKNVPEPNVSGEMIGIITPHAGYIFSGLVAASAYKILLGKSYDTVIIVGANHYDNFQGASIYPGDGYETPLGIVHVNKELAKSLALDEKLINLDRRGHGGREHSIEVQLPFLQSALNDFQIVPINIGTPDLTTCSALGRKIAEVCADKNILLIASSDLSHYHSYEDAVRMDTELIRSIREYDYMMTYQNIVSRKWEACGFGAITTVMLASQWLGANQIQITKYANSGDVPGMDRSGVVGYVGAILTNNPEKKTGLPEADKKSLLRLAKESIIHAVSDGPEPECNSLSEKILVPKGAFVTINKNGQLRGCIGYILAYKPLYETIIDVAASAALTDPRFPPLKESELNEIDISISVLTPLQKIIDTDKIQVGTHGIFIIYENKQGILLPEVATDNGWDRLTFLEQTCYKAGFPLDTWKNKDAEIFIFSSEYIH